MSVSALAPLPANAPGRVSGSKGLLKPFLSPNLPDSRSPPPFNGQAAELHMTSVLPT